MFKKYKLRDFDFRLIILVLLAACISIVAVNSANEEYVSKQLMGIGVGFAMMMVIAFIDYGWVLKLNWLMYIGMLGLLFATGYTSVGDSGGGAQRWIEIGPLRFQP